MSNFKWTPEQIAILCSLGSIKYHFKMRLDIDISLEEQSSIYYTQDALDRLKNNPFPMKELGMLRRYHSELAKYQRAWEEVKKQEALK